MPYAGEEMTIGFNSRYVLDALGAQGAEQIVTGAEGRIEPRNGQKLRGGRIALCYHAHENLTFSWGQRSGAHPVDYDRRIP